MINRAFATWATNGKNGDDRWQQFRELAYNALLSRKEWFDRFLDPRRSIADECGWPKGGDLTPQKYQDLYDREPVATRVVQVMPRECWQVQPSVYEDEDAENATAFEDAWDALGQSLRGENSWYRDEQG